MGLLALLIGDRILAGAILGIVLQTLRSVWMPPPGAPPAPVLMAAAGVHAVVAALLLRRRPRQAAATTTERLALVPLVAAGFLAPALAPPRWPSLAVGAFVAGASLTVASFLTLGRSFGILPARRGLVTAGPYRVVRHPAYLGEAIMAAAALLPSGGLGVAALGLVIASVVVRILREEHLLRDDPDHARYAASVRSRLIPGIW